MSEAGSTATSQREAAFPVFISYATADRKKALSICNALERRGVKCWISCRDVGPGENYQEAIVVAIQSARAVVLVFSGAANNSNEIKKELSLASRFGPTVIALRIEDVEPSNAFGLRTFDPPMDRCVRWLGSLDRRARQRHCRFSPCATRHHRG